MEKKEEKKVCCICGKEYEGYGYNPFPVKEEGCCCQSCNYSVVVPERWERHKAYQRGEATGAGKVYISGAIAHYDMDERKEAFSRAEEELKAQGYDPVNPFRNGLPDEAHWRAHMRADIALLLACDYIYMLKDWELTNWNLTWPVRVALKCCLNKISRYGKNKNGNRCCGDEVDRYGI